MKRQIQVFVPKPCHEDWNKMSPTQQGKFCSSCQKKVVDFSSMTDNEILNYFLKTTGNICGRFATDQLQRPLQPLKTGKKKSWWIALLMPFLLLFNKANAQKKIPKNATTNNAATKNPEPIIMGKAMPREILPDTTRTIGDTIYCKRTLGNAQVIIEDTNRNAKFILIQGKIIDQNSEPIAGATIALKGTNIATVANIIGEYKLLIPKIIESDEIVISCVGYQDAEITIEKDELNNILLKNVYNRLDEVVVISYGARLLRTVAGTSYLVHKIEYKPIDTLIRKVFKAEVFKKYPNPVLRGNMLHIDTKRTGEYSIQIFDNSSKLLLAEDFSATENNTITEINIPTLFVAGVYYIRLVNKKTKKEYTDKLIVQ